MQVNSYEVLRRAVEDGIAYGWRRAHKHTDTPNEVYIQDQILDAIMNEACEYFNFDPDCTVHIPEAYDDDPKLCGEEFGELCMSYHNIRIGSELCHQCCATKNHSGPHNCHCGTWDE